MEFYEKFKTLSNTDLLRIVANPSRYQPEAFDTAKRIIAERCLTVEELALANGELELEMEQETKKRVKKEQTIKDLENRVKQLGNSIIEEATPSQKKAQSVEKTINIISILFAALSLVRIYGAFGMLKFMFTDSSAKWDLATVLLFVPIIILSIATFLFFKRKKWGWIGLAYILSYFVLSGLHFSIFLLKSIYFKSGDSYLNFPLSSLISQLLAVLFFSATIWLMGAQKIRTIYKVSMLTLYSALGTAIGVAAFELIFYNNIS